VDGLEMGLMIKLFLLIFFMYLPGTYGQGKGSLSSIPSLDTFTQLIGGPNEALSIGAGNVFINPALMTNNKKSEVLFSNLINGYSLRYFSSALVIPLNESHYLGLGVFGMNIPLSEIYDGESYSLRYSENYYTNIDLNYAYKAKRFSLGAGLKHISYSMLLDNYDKKAQNWEMTLGIYSSFSKNVRLGAVYQKILDRAPKRRQDGILLNDRLGASVVWQPLDYIEDRLQVLVSAEKIGDENINVNYGLIFQPFKRQSLINIGVESFKIRTGTGNYNIGSLKLPGYDARFFDESNKMKVGAGIKFSPIFNVEFGFNFCFQYNNLSQNMNLLTTGLKF
jgi:hypothetical protein